MLFLSIVGVSSPAVTISYEPDTQCDSLLYDAAATFLAWTQRLPAVAYQLERVARFLMLSISEGYFRNMSRSSLVAWTPTW